MNKVREAFERWFIEENKTPEDDELWYHPWNHRNADGAYHWNDAREAWEIWSAAFRAAASHYAMDGALLDGLRSFFAARATCGSGVAEAFVESIDAYREKVGG